MSGRLLVAGAGKMGRNVGLHFARNGWQVGWLSRDGERLTRAARWLGRRLKKLPADASLGMFGPDDPLPRVDLVLEAVQEDREAKVALLATLEAALPGPAPGLLSTTSSLLPDELHPRLDVAHFFYPLELTAMVELVPGARGRRAQDLVALLQGLGLRVLVQNRRSAFLLNRLLLPLQSEVTRELMTGAEPARVDEQSAASPLCPVGQLGLMDSVGLDVVHAAVVSYMNRMNGDACRAHAPLLRAVGIARAQGRRGIKSGAGLLAGERLTWGPLPGETGTWDPLPERSPAPAEQWPALLCVTCRRAVELALIEAKDLDDALARVFGAEATLAQEEARLGPAALEAAARLPYFRVDADPAGLFI